MSTSDRPTVLVVEDEPDVAETYELWLAGDYEVRRAESGEEALANIDDDVDVVLLDRMMPETSGDEVLAEIRSRELDCRVAMVSAVDPDFDIIEMGFDEYVTKPPEREELRRTIEALLETGDYAAHVREYRSLLAKRSALRSEKSESELARSEAYSDLEAEIESMRAELDDEQPRLRDDAAFVSALRDLTDDGKGGDGPAW